MFDRGSDETFPINSYLIFEDLNFEDRGMGDLHGVLHVIQNFALDRNITKLEKIALNQHMVTGGLVSGREADSTHISMSFELRWDFLGDQESQGICTQVVEILDVGENLSEIIDGKPKSISGDLYEGICGILSCSASTK